MQLQATKKLTAVIIRRSVEGSFELNPIGWDQKEGTIVDIDDDDPILLAEAQGLVKRKLARVVKPRAAKAAPVDPAPPESDESDNPPETAPDPAAAKKSRARKKGSKKK